MTTAIPIYPILISIKYKFTSFARCTTKITQHYTIGEPGLPEKDNKTYGNCSFGSLLHLYQQVIYCSNLWINFHETPTEVPIVLGT